MMHTVCKLIILDSFYFMLASLSFGMHLPVLCHTLGYKEVTFLPFSVNFPSHRNIKLKNFSLKKLNIRNVSVLKSLARRNYIFTLFFESNNAA